MGHRLKFVIIGSACVDKLHFSDEGLPPDGKVDPIVDADEPSSKIAGGGGVNAALALMTYLQAKNIEADVILHTKIGAAEYQGTKGIIENEHRRFLLRELADSGVVLRDLAEDRFNYIPCNIIACKPDGRTILKDPDAKRTMLQFQGAASQPSQAVMDRLFDDIADADGLLVFGSYGAEAVAAAKKGAEVRTERLNAGSGRPLKIVTDYDVRDASKAWDARPTLVCAEYITTPHDSIAPGITEQNEFVLFNTIVNDPAYTACLTAVSNGGSAVRVNHDYGEQYVFPGRPIRVVDNSGSGDVKSGVLLAEVVTEDDAWTAILRANRVATFATQYKGRGWMPDLPDFMQTDEFREWEPQKPFSVPRLRLVPSAPETPPTPAPVAA